VTGTRLDPRQGEFAGFAPTKAAAHLTESIARDMGPPASTSPASHRRRDRYARMRARMSDKPDEFFIAAAIADELYHLYGQDRSAGHSSRNCGHSAKTGDRNRLQRERAYHESAADAGPERSEP
jgi:hypothetical protein